MIHTEQEAKRWFVDRVLRRARDEGVLLSDDERQMLSWSESDPEFVAGMDPDLPTRLAEQISDEEYEAKVAGLLVRAYGEDVSRDPAAAETWRHVQAVLRQGDHYISIMIERAVSPRQKRWWEFWR